MVPRLGGSAAWPGDGSGYGHPSASRVCSGTSHFGCHMACGAVASIGDCDCGTAVSMRPHHGSPSVIAPKLDRDGRRGVRRLDSYRSPGVIEKNNVRRWIGQGGLDTQGVSVDIATVRPMGDLVIPSPEDGVVDGRAELTGAAPDIQRVVTAVALSIEKDRSRDITLRPGPWT